MKPELKSALIDLVFRLGDDDFILGHRHSEWIGIGPILEEDIAFSSMAQDEIGHAEAYYQLLHEHFQLPDPDTLGFERPWQEFRCAHLVEYPNKDYAFSLVRHFLYDHAEHIRLQALQKQDVFKPLKELAKRLLREEKYHVFHANTWIVQLSNGSEEARVRLQTALDEAYPMALALFEPNEHEKTLVEAKVLPSENELQKEWLRAIQKVLEQTPLKLPENPQWEMHKGGRVGKHTPHLEAIIEEMTEVRRLDPQAEW